MDLEFRRLVADFESAQRWYLDIRVSEMRTSPQGDIQFPSVAMKTALIAAPLVRVKAKFTVTFTVCSDIRRFLLCEFGFDSREWRCSQSMEQMALMMVISINLGLFGEF